MSTTILLHGRQFRQLDWKLTPERKKQMLSWVNQFNICCFMDNHGYETPMHSYDCLIAAGARHCIERPAGQALTALTDFKAEQNDWLFGHLGFGLKAETMGCPSQLDDPLGFPDLFFFVPEHLILVASDKLLISSYSMEADALLEQIGSIAISNANEENVAHSRFDGADSTDYDPRRQSALSFEPAMNAAEYINRVEKLRSHIHRGDCYEINFCQEFRSKQAVIDPVKVFHQLVSLSPNPFSVYYKWNQRYLLCASPERFFRLEGRTVWSQPIKGTSPRYPGDAGLDRASAEQLAASPKERAENVMVVDLVRNDLSRICVPGTVQVEELFGVQSFPQVHQLVSTIRGELEPGKNVVDIIRACFPMGSMTGAPKKKVLELIEQYELIQRGLFSGAVGYIKPTGDADFNVVIRSLLYNEADRYLSCQVGSGITWYADAGKEYEECLLKAEAIRKTLGLQ